MRKIMRTWKIFGSIFQRSSNVTTTERLHSALGYRSPQEFEEATDSSDAASISIVAKLKFAH